MKRLALATLALLALAAPSPRAARAAAPDSGADGYAVETTGSTRQLKVGQVGKLVLAIHPKAPWHVDPRAPLTVKLEAPAGLQPEKASASRKDAVDPKAEVPRFELPVTAKAAGAQEVKAHLKFFLCKETICAQQTTTVAFAVAVK